MGAFQPFGIKRKGEACLHIYGMKARSLKMWVPEWVFLIIALVGLMFAWGYWYNGRWEQKCAFVNEASRQMSYRILNEDYSGAVKLTGKRYSIKPEHFRTMEWWDKMHDAPIAVLMGNGVPAHFISMQLRIGRLQADE